MKTITTRDVWGAVPPKSETEEPLKTPVKMLLMMDTQSAECNTRDDCLLAVKELQRVYMEEKGYDDIPWNFLIGGDGGIYEGRGWKKKSFKPDLTNPIQKKYDGTSLDIAYIGDFKKKFTTKKMQLAFGTVVVYAIDEDCLTMIHDMKVFVKKQSMKGRYIKLPTIE